MGAAKLKRAQGSQDYFLSTLFSREQNGPVDVEHVVKHEIGHAVANILLDYPIEYSAVTLGRDGSIDGFTKNDPEAKAKAEAAMRRHDRGRALELSAINLAGPLAEYRSCVQRQDSAAHVSVGARIDKMSAFRAFCYANALEGETRFSYETGDIDLSTPLLSGFSAAWAQWKVDAYALAKATLEAPGVWAAVTELADDMIARLRKGGEVRISGSDVSAALAKRREWSWRTA